MKKEFTKLDIISVVVTYQEEVKDKITDFPVKIQWKISKNIEPFFAEYDKILQLKDELTEKFNTEWFTEENAEPIEMPSEENPEEMVSGLKIKDEIMEKYTEAGKIANEEYQKLLQEVVEIEIESIDMDAAIDALPDDTKLTVNDLALLEIINK